MKKMLFSIVFLFLVLPVLPQYEGLPPLRYAKEVNRVSALYRLTNWLISPSEEAFGDHKVKNAGECDIRGVAAVNDARRLRVDIYLHNPITFKWKVYYSFKVMYKFGSYDMYIYFPTTNKFYYSRWNKNGKLLESRILKKNRNGDTCYITDSFVNGIKKRNTVVSLILEKDKHISRTGRGTKKYLSVRFFSGFVKMGTGSNWTKGLRVADTTPEVRLGFIR